MKKNILFTLLLLFLFLFTATLSNAGYRKDPWGSSTWTGPAKPPHWSSESTPGKTKPVKPQRRIARGPHGDSERGIRPPRHHRTKGGYWKDTHNRWRYHRHRRAGYVYYREPKVDRVVIERKKPVFLYPSAPPKHAIQRCGGDTVTRRDQDTGTLIIEYITGSKRCP